MATATSPSSSSTTPGATTRSQGFLFGHPIAHSMSPLLHSIVFAHLAMPTHTFAALDSLDLPAFVARLRSGACYGSAVTMPHKLAILPHLDELTLEATAVGACNTVTVTRRGDSEVPWLVGTNTDVIGIRESFYQNVTHPAEVFENRPALVIGGGGAARSAVYALRTWMRAPEIYLVNRDAAEVAAVIAECTRRGFAGRLTHVASVAQAETLAGVGAVVACVPDIPPRTPSERETRRVVETMLRKAHKGAWLEMAYHPRPWTELAVLARAAGWQVILGTEAMIWQGLEQSRCWTGRELSELPVAEVKRAVAERLALATAGAPEGAVTVVEPGVSVGPPAAMTTAAMH